MSDINVVISILEYAKGKNIKLWVNNDSLEYEAPAGAMTPEFILELKENKNSIIRFLKLNKEQIKKQQIEPIIIQDSYELSNAQKRLWIMDQFDNESITYNIPSALIFEGELIIDAFKQAYSFMLERHESLRTVFITENGEPRQKILEDPEYNIEIIDLRDNGNPEKEVNILTEKDLLTPFNLEKGPLIRFSIIMIENKKNLVLFNMHHIVSDGWSMNILTREFLSVYNSFRMNEIPDLEALRIHYKDYTAWQNKLLKSPEMEKQRKYWLDKLSGEIPVLDLPSDNVRPAVQTFNGNYIEFTLSKEILSPLNNMCRVNQVSMFMLLQTMVKIFLYKYTGEDDIILGSPIAGRVHEDLENQIGFYVNTLVFRDSISSKKTFIDLLESVKITCTDAFDNQDYPFDQLVEDLDLKRDLSRSPLFDVMLVLQNNDNTAIGFDDLKVFPYETENLISKYDLTFNFSESGNRLFCGIEYNTDIYSGDRIERMVKHLETLIGSVVENPGTQIKDLNIIPEEEKYLLLNVFNDSKTQYPTDRTIAQLFEEQVEKTPDNIAVVFENIELTYREINEKSNIVACFLRENYDIRPDDFIGIMLERSEKMIIAVLGIIKAGAAYVPIDPEYPKDRIEYIIEDSNPKVVLSDINKSLLIDIDSILDSGLCSENPIRISNQNNLAYVIYTSGSTGKPKGVLIENRSVLNLIQSQIRLFGIDETERILQFTNICFDASVEQIWLALFSGAAIVVISKKTLLISEDFNKYLSVNKITHIDTVPSFLQDIDIKLNKELKRIILGGEGCPVSLAQEYYRKTALFNCYGPTETTVTSIKYKVNKVENNQTIIPIGKSLDNTQIYIVDKDLNLSPHGVSGELCISGSGLARGYLNRPDLTAEKFITNPFSPAERMYRTGDLVRWLPDGNIEFLGRIDDQVKIRGFRIELGEIEHCIQDLDDVKACTVIGDIKSNNPNFLLGYFCLDNNKIKLSNMDAYICTLSQRPELKNRVDQIHKSAWPDYFKGNVTTTEYWERIYSDFPDYQLVITDNNKNVLAAINSIPIYWSGENKDLPYGWDAVISDLFTGENIKKGNTLCVLAGVVNDKYKNRGLSYHLLDTVKRLANSLGLSNIIIPVRPTLKNNYQDMDLEDYCSLKKDDGKLYDPWLRVHENSGGELIGYSKKSQEIIGTIDDWENWSGIKIDESGEYKLKDTMQCISIDINKNTGIYYDQAVWFRHKISNSTISLTNVTIIKNHLSKLLPDYMVPSYLIHMDFIPLTSNGKIDRKSLPKPDGTTSSNVKYVAPRNETEGKLVEIWQDILGIEKIGICDNFFELGGHSLKATRVVSRISRDLEVEVSLKDILTNPSIESLVHVISLSIKKEYSQIEKVSIQETYELSNAQKRLWVLDQLEENSIAYNMPGVFILEGEFNEKAFRKAYLHIISRHESLRTVFLTEDGNPRQKILESPGFSINITDLRNNVDKELKAKELVEEEFSTSFNLSTGPLIRFGLIHLEDDKYIVLFNMHHIISDGWSMNILTRDFLASYNSIRKNKIPDMEPLRIHYKDYSAWQNSFLESSGVETKRNYWLEKLSGELPVLDLPGDKNRPKVQTFNGAHLGFILPTEVQSELNGLCRGNNISLFMLLQSLVKVLIHKYTGQQDIIIGTPIAGRVHGDLENQIGFYLNNLVLRDTVESECSFSDFLNVSAQTCSEAFDNQGYPFDRIVEDLDLKRDLSRSPLFDILVILQNNETTELEFDGLSVLPYQATTGTEASKFDITFDFTEIPEGIHCVLKFNTDIYSADRMERMGRHFEILVSSILKNPDSKIKDIDIIPEHEKNILLEHFNNTNVDYPADRTIVDLFEEQVEKTPDNIAVIFKDIHLTYRELNGKANIVANYLLDNHEVKQDELVGVFLHRSEKMIIALLGILKSGAAYVPIEVDYPEERQKYIIEDSDPKVIISDDSENNHIDINEILKGNNSENPGISIKPESILYVLYTSGTTGKPKGIMTKHENVVNFVLWGRDYFFDDGIEGNFGLFSSISFDFTSTSLYLSLLRGKMLTVFDQRDDIDRILFSVFNDSNVDSVKLTPSHISLLQDLGISGSKIKLVITGGEELLEEHVKILRETSTDEFKIVNAYGPTESTMTCIVKTIADGEKILIGKPMANVRIHIMDKNTLTGLGIPGEICVSGAGISRGYLNRDELTTEKFVDSPFVSTGKMYRTGDLGRWLPDGNIDFLGRIDSQIKIRGFRVEPGEIERVFLEHGSIDSAVVISSKNGNGENELLAYYLSAEELEISEIHDFLKSSLPDYMIPSYFIHMDSIPLTPNGKIDKKSLPEPDGTHSRGMEYVAPRNEIEEQVASIWQDILGVDKIGIFDNFFELGGHSLKAIRVVTRISKDLEVDILLKDIFSNPFIKSLSKIINIASKTKYNRIEIISPQDSYRVSNAQKRLWVLDQLEENSVAYNMPVVFILEGEFNENAFKEAYSYLVQRHESLRTVFVTEDGNPRQKVLEDPGFSIDITDLRNVADKEVKVEEIVGKNLSTPFDLSTGPLIRFGLIHLEDDKHIILFNIHHIISDGWSMNILTRDFLSAYNSFRRNLIPDLEPLRVHYKDYSAWLNTSLNSSKVEMQRIYWLDKLSGELPVLDLPVDNVRPAVQTFNGNSVGFVLSKDINSNLNDLCLENNASLFMMLQALVKVLIYRYTGQEDIILGSPIAGRVHEDLENQIGFYVNNLCLRDSIEGDLTFNEFLGGVKKTCTDAFDNQEYPFDALIEELNIKRDISRSPLFDVMVVLHNNETTTVEFDGLKLSPYNIENEISKFDMSFHFNESAEGLFCSIEYNTDIYLENRMERLCEHLKILISSVLESPESKVKDLEIIPVDEMNLLLNVFNNTKTDYPRDKTIVDLFEEQVERTPDNIAVVFEDVKLTYRELNEKANIVGHYLRDNYDIEPDNIVGVLLGRSEKMIIVLIGILKSGAAYIPLDPEFPVDRIRYMLKDSCPKVVMSERKDLSVNDIEILDINDVLKSDKSVGNLGKVANPDHLAYVIYTSGSTGKPKGTLVVNRTVVNFIKGITDRIDFKPDKAVVSVTTFSFDIFVLESFLPLTVGQRVVVANKVQQTDPFALKELIMNNHVDMIQTTPSRIKMLTSDDSLLETLSSLSEIMVGGEAFPEELLEILNKHCDGKIYNMYGPTETTVWSTFSFLNGEKSVNIGRPIANTQIYILDRQKSLVPFGVSGELHIAGEGLSAGYLNKPELTAEKFIDNPFVSGQRMYKTGDLARWLENGNIEFLGRIDSQVKIRGFRIELGEIENALAQYNDISSVVVITKEMIYGEKHLVAYFVSDKSLESSELRSFLRNSLPDYMIPSFFIHMETLPLTPNGKIDWKVLPDVDGSISCGVEYVAPRNEIQEKLVLLWQEVLGIDRVGILDNFFELGGNSLTLIRLSSKINKEMNLDVSVMNLYTYTTIQSLVENIFEDKSSGNTIDEERLTSFDSDSQDIAIIGMAGRFPGATNISEYWNNIKEGLDSITQFTREELIEIGHNEKDIVNPDYVKAFGALKEKEFFDAGFFGYSPTDTEIMNPQIRIFHEDAWSVLEDGGYNPEEYSGSIGVFAGASQNINWTAGTYFSNSGLSPMEINQLSGSNFMSSRVSHKLNLRGPSSFINTACSTSLVNIVMACENLILNRCDMALAGGISIGAETKSGYLYSEGSISSPDGHCRAFSSDAAGTVGGEGSGIVLLKKLDNALLDNDNIHAVIKGYGINNDGKRKVGYTAPSVLGQAELIKDVQQRAGIDPESITYIEAHGTGTKMGDPIEVEALKMAFNTSKRQFCGIGSVKSNIGHLDSAAGVAGVIKTVQSLKNRQLPPTLHVETANPLLKIEESPFYINTKLKSWESGGVPLRAGVSSFGIGGTNAHIILEEAPKVEISKPGKSYEIINLSAKTKTALENNIRNLLGFLMVNREINLSDLSYTLNVGRKHFNYRYSVAVSSIDELIINLEKEQDSYLSIKHITSDIKRKIIFMFPGQGSQYKNMGLDLYQNEVIFRDAVDRCFEILKQNREVDFNEVLFGQSDINESQNSSCAIFIIEYALYQLLKSRGINPDVMIGHSLGEYTSACVSGVLSLKDSLTLVYDRGILINQLSSGSMLSVYIDKDKLLPLMDETVSLAVENSDSLFVVSGSIESIEKLKTELERLGYNTKQIKSTHAFHSHMLEPILDDFKNILKKLNFDNPQIPYISNVTGTMVKPDEVKNIDYWVKHFRGTVNFNSGVKELLKDEDSIIIEVGPGKSLTSLINSNRYKCNTHRIVNTLKSNKEELNDSLFFQNKCSEIWTSGAIIDWKEYYKNEERRRISLPAYAFDKTYFGKLFNIMLDRSKINQDIAGISSNSKTLTYLPSWERDVIPQITIDEKYNYLIFKEELGVSEKLGSKLLEFGKNVVFVIHGDTYLKVSDSEYILDHTKSEDYSRLFRDISDNSFIPERIIHSWSINEKNVKEISIDSVSRDNEFGLYSAFNIAKAINEVDIDKEIEIYFISKDIHNVLGFETLSPSQSLILSALKVISTEFSNIECCNIDLGHYDINKIPTYLIDQIINELNSPITDYQIAFRRNTRWILKYKSIEIGKYSKEIKLKKAGVYLITGGLGGIGLTFSKYLAEEYNAKLVLTTRQDFPDKKEWNRIINDPAENRYKSKIKDLIDFTKSGSEILVCSADVADKNEMVKLVDLVEKKWGLINGVIHTAGIADGKLIQLREKIDIENVLKAKIDGTIILTEILNMCDLDFMVLCSSLTCISGGVGQFAYTAANQFLDSFADSSRLKGNNVTSINWCGWQDVGMLANSTYYKEEDKYQYSIKPLEGVDILKSVLGSSFSNIAVSRFDINAFFEFNKSFNIEDITEQKSIKYYSRPELSVEYCPPTNDIEKRIIEIWQELFGIKGIGIDDDFFELGGHSLKGISFITKIREIFHINLNFDQIYEFSSIQKISQIILNSQNIKNVNKKSNGKREVFKL